MTCHCLFVYDMLCEWLFTKGKITQSLILVEGGMLSLGCLNYSLLERYQYFFCRKGMFCLFASFLKHLKIFLKSPQFVTFLWSKSLGQNHNLFQTLTAFHFEAMFMWLPGWELWTQADVRVSVTCISFAHVIGTTSST